MNEKSQKIIRTCFQNYSNPPYLLPQRNKLYINLCSGQAFYSMVRYAAYLINIYINIYSIWNYLKLKKLDEKNIYIYKIPLSKFIKKVLILCPKLKTRVISD